MTPSAKWRDLRLNLLRTTRSFFLENKKVPGLGNIDSRMPVLLLEAAWPRSRKQSVGAVWPAEPPKRPSQPAPGWDAFYLAT